MCTAASFQGPLFCAVALRDKETKGEKEFICYALSLFINSFVS